MHSCALLETNFDLHQLIHVITHDIDQLILLSVLTYDMDQLIVLIVGNKVELRYICEGKTITSYSGLSLEATKV